MKKKIILMLSMMALLVCVFAVSVSASTFSYGFDSIIGEISNISMSGNYVYNNVSSNYAFIDDIECIFGYQKLDVDLKSGRINSILIFNVEGLHQFVVEHNITSIEEFETLDDIFVEEKLVPFDSDSSGNLIPASQLVNCWYLDYEIVWEAYQSYVAEISVPTYEDGKADGVTEYKASTEYNAVLEGEYNRGMEEGLADGKTNYLASDEYKASLQLENDKGYRVGYQAGFENFRVSEECLEMLNDSYDDGYTAGANSVEQNNDDNVIVTFFPLLFIVCVILIAFSVFNSVKRRKRK